MQYGVLLFFWSFRKLPHLIAGQLVELSGDLNRVTEISALILLRQLASPPVLGTKMTAATSIRKR